MLASDEPASVLLGLDRDVKLFLQRHKLAMHDSWEVAGPQRSLASTSRSWSLSRRAGFREARPRRAPPLKSVDRMTMRAAERERAAASRRVLRDVVGARRHEGPHGCSGIRSEVFYAWQRESAATQSRVLELVTESSAAWLENMGWGEGWMRLMALHAGVGGHSFSRN